MADFATEKKQLNDALATLRPERVYIPIEVPDQTKIRNAAQIETYKFLVNLDERNPGDSIDRYERRLTSIYAQHLASGSTASGYNAVLVGVQNGAAAFYDAATIAMAVRAVVTRQLPVPEFVRMIQGSDTEGFAQFMDFYERRYSRSMRRDLQENLSNPDWELIKALLEKNVRPKAEIDGRLLYYNISSLNAAPDEGILHTMRALTHADLMLANKYITEHITPQTHRTFDDQLNSMLPRTQLEQARAILHGDVGLDLTLEVKNSGKSSVDRERLFETLRNRTPAELADLSVKFLQRTNQPLPEFLRSHFGTDEVNRFVALLVGDKIKEQAIALNRFLTTNPMDWDGVQILMKSQSDAERTLLLARFGENSGNSLVATLAANIKDPIERLDFDTIFNSGKRSVAASLKRALDNQQFTESQLLQLLNNTVAADFDSAIGAYAMAYPNGNLPLLIATKFPSERIKNRLFELNPVSDDFQYDMARYEAALPEAKSGVFANWSSKSNAELTASDHAKQTAELLDKTFSKDFPRLGGQLTTAFLRVAETGLQMAQDEKRDTARFYSNLTAMAVNVIAMAGTEGMSLPASARVFGTALTGLAAATTVKHSIGGASFKSDEFYADSIAETAASPLNLLGGSVVKSALRNRFLSIAEESLRAEFRPEIIKRFGTRGFQQAIVQEANRLERGYGIHTHLFGAASGGAAALGGSAALQIRAGIRGEPMSVENVAEQTARGIVVGAAAAAIPHLIRNGLQLPSRLNLRSAPTPAPVELAQPTVTPAPEIEPTPANGKKTSSSLPQRKLEPRDERMRNYQPRSHPAPAVPKVAPIPEKPLTGREEQTNSPGLRSAPIPEKELVGKVTRNGDAWSILAGEMESGVRVAPVQWEKAREFYRDINSSSTQLDLMRRLGGRGGLRHVTNSYFLQQTGIKVDGYLLVVNLSRLQRMVFSYEGPGRWGNFWIGDYHD